MRIAIITGSAIWMRILAEEFSIRLDKNKLLVFVEDNYSISSFIRQFVLRLRRYGWFKLMDQILLQGYLVIRRPWRWLGEFRSVGSIVPVASVNAVDFRKRLIRENIDVLVCIGTSLIEKDTFELPNICCLNVHPGINPRYRGAGGNFWAVQEENWNQLGATVHNVDSGIDTGSIVFQRYVSIDPTLDSFEKITYRSIQLALSQLAILLEQPDCQDQLKTTLLISDAPRTYGWYGLSHYVSANRKLRNYAHRFIADKRDY